MTRHRDPVTCAPRMATWFGRRSWPDCACGFAPRDNAALTAHWAEAGFRVVEDGGQLVRIPINASPSLGASDSPVDQSPTESMNGAQRATSHVVERSYLTRVVQRYRVEGLDLSDSEGYGPDLYAQDELILQGELIEDHEDLIDDDDFSLHLIPVEVNQ